MISVIIPTCQRIDLLARCLDQLAPGRQALPSDNYEVIVTDDGRTVTADGMIRDRYPWARWTAGPRRGPAANRNHGVSLVRGRWLAFTDDDCLPSTDWLSAYAAAAVAPGAVTIFEGRTTCAAGYDPLKMEAPVNLTGGSMWSCNLMLERNTFCELGGFDENFKHWCEDLDLSTRIRNAGRQVRFVPNAIVDHPPRPRPDGWTLGGRWEARAQLSLKYEPSQSLWRWLPLHLLKVRIAQTIAGGPRMASVRFAGTSAVELTRVLLYLSYWQKQYSGNAHSEQ